MKSLDSIFFPSPFRVSCQSALFYYCCYALSQKKLLKYKGFLFCFFQVLSTTKLSWQFSFEENSRKMAPLLLILLSVISSITGQTPPVISRFGGQIGKNHHVLLIEGPTNRFTLECQAKGQPVPSVLWYRNDDVIVDESSLEGISMPKPEILEFAGMLSKMTIVGYF